jgi:outer membrane cobalamin receptor
MYPQALGLRARPRPRRTALATPLVALLLGGAPAVAEGSPATRPAASFDLRGRVRDTLLSVVEGCVVEASDASGARVAKGRSDERGEFVLPALAAGLYRVRVSAAGFTTTSLVVDVGPGTMSLDFILEIGTDQYVGRVKGIAPAGQTGSSAATITRDALQTLPGGDAQSLSDIIAVEPGIVRDVFGIGPVHVRANQNGIVYALDGVLLPQGLLFQFAETVPTRLVQSVNLLTGGLPAEYGSQNGAGGVIDVTTRRPSERPEGEVQLLYGTYQTIQPSAAYSQAFGKWDVFLEGTYLGTQLGLNPPDVSPILHDAEIAGSAFGKVDYDATAKDRLELIAEFAQHNFQVPIDPTVLPLSDAPPGAVRGVDSYGNAPPVFVPYNAHPTEAEQDLFATLAYVRVSEGTRLQVSPYVRYTTSHLNCDPVLSLGATADPGTTCANVDRRLWHEGASATYAWSMGAQQRWKAGVLLDDTQSALSYSQFTRDDESPSGGPDPGLTINGGDHINILLAGAFVQDEITVGKAKFFPGVRADVQNAVFEASHQPQLLLAGPSARLGFSYAFSDALVLHAYAGYLWSPPTSLDAPVAAARLAGVTGAIPAADNLKPERDEDAELGLAYRIFRRLKASLTAWGRYSQDTIDVQNVGPTSLVVNYNYARGRAVGVELAADAVASKYLTAFGNVTWELGYGQGVDSAQYLFAPADLAYTGWQILDHVQNWTVNAGADLHDEAARAHFSVLAQYGSGLRTGPNNDETVPGHFTLNATVRYRFDFVLRPEIAIDVLNVLDAEYPLRIANGYFDGAYGPPRQVDLRLIVPFGG